MKQGTPFQQSVWNGISKIPAGEVITYKELARRIGRPRAIRAVGNAVAANPNPPEIPCHRVIRSDSTIGGYSGKGGVAAKRKLLRNEGIVIDSK